MVGLWAARQSGAITLITYQPARALAVAISRPHPRLVQQCTSHLPLIRPCIVSLNNHPRVTPPAASGGAAHPTPLLQTATLPFYHPLPPHLHPPGARARPHTLEGLVTYVTGDLELVDAHARERVVGDGECDVEGWVRSWAGRPVGRGSVLLTRDVCGLREQEVRAPAPRHERHVTARSVTPTSRAGRYPEAAGTLPQSVERRSLAASAWLVLTVQSSRPDAGGWAQVALNKNASNTHETNDPVNVGGLSLATSELIVHRKIWVCGSNSAVPPPTWPSTAPSCCCCARPRPSGRRSPAGVAEMDVVVDPRKMETTMSSIGRAVTRGVSVSAKRPGEEVRCAVHVATRCVHDVELSGFGTHPRCRPLSSWP